MGRGQPRFVFLLARPLFSRPSLAALSVATELLTDRKAADEDVESGAEANEDRREFHDLSPLWKTAEERKEECRSALARKRRVERRREKLRTCLGGDTFLKGVGIRVGIALEIPDEGDHRVVHLRTNERKENPDQRRLAPLPSPPPSRSFRPSFPNSRLTP